MLALGGGLRYLVVFVGFGLGLRGWLCGCCMGFWVCMFCLGFCLLCGFIVDVSLVVVCCVGFWDFGFLVWVVLVC